MGKEKKFSIKNTSCAKGVAILALLIHHCLDQTYDYVTLIPSENLVLNTVSLGKVCVYIFFILSAYGLTKSFEKKEKTIKKTIVFTIKHLLKLMSNYWFVFLVFVPLGVYFDRPMEAVYVSAMNMVYDILGVAYFMSVPSFNSSWWFIDMIILFYLIFPITYFIVKLLGRYNVVFFLVIAGVATQYHGTKIWLINYVAFLLGVIIAEYNLFERIYLVLQNDLKSRIIKFLIYMFCCVIFIYVRITIMNDAEYFWYRIDWIFAFLIIMMTYQYLKTEDGVGKILVVLGEQSSNIFLFHTFIYAFYFKDYIYSFRVGVIIIAVMCIVCLQLSYAVEFLKRKTGYNTVIEIIQERIESF